MKRIFLFIAAFSIASSIQAQKVIFVKSTGTGNGSSWEHAMGDLQEALKSAQYGVQIWVAAGTYTPTNTTDRNISFNIPDGVQLFGGFSGNEIKRDDRNPVDNPTILSGEIGTPSTEDNSYTVVYTKNVGEKTIVDGFTITGGFSNLKSEKGDKRRAGAGWYNDGSNGVSNPTIVNCIFRNNYGRDGAGIYNYGYDGNASPSIKNCKFIANRADIDGGAIYNDGTNGKSSPYIENCLFEGNEATYGAGILNEGDGGEVMPIIIECDFNDNIAYLKGGSIYDVLPKQQGIVEAIVKNSRLPISYPSKVQYSDSNEKANYSEDYFFFKRKSRAAIIYNASNNP